MRRLWPRVFAIAAAIALLVFVWSATDEPSTSRATVTPASTAERDAPWSMPEPTAIVRAEAKAAPVDTAHRETAREEPVHFTLRSNDANAIFAGTLNVVYVEAANDELRLEGSTASEQTRTVALPANGVVDVPIPARARLRRAVVEPAATGLGWRQTFFPAECSFRDETIYLDGEYHKAIWLYRGFTVSGTVIDALSHGPVADAEITWTGQQQPWPEERVSTLAGGGSRVFAEPSEPITTDESGHFRASYVPRRVRDTTMTAELRVRHERYLTATRLVPNRSRARR